MVKVNVLGQTSRSRSNIEFSAENSVRVKQEPSRTRNCSRIGSDSVAPRTRNISDLGIKTNIPRTRSFRIRDSREPEIAPRTPWPETTVRRRKNDAIRQKLASQIEKPSISADLAGETLKILLHRDRTVNYT